MSLVDDKQGDFQALQQGLELGVGKAFRRREDDARAAVRHGQFRIPQGLGIEGAVELYRGDSELVQLVALILHQRDQGRDDDRHARKQRRRQLIAQGLARAGRHHGKRVQAAQRALHHRLLAGPKLAKTEDPAKLGWNALKKVCGHGWLPWRTCDRSWQALRVLSCIDVFGAKP